MSKLSTLLTTRIAHPSLNGRDVGSYADSLIKGSSKLEDGRVVIDGPLAKMVASYVTWGDDPSRGPSPVTFRLNAKQKAKVKTFVDSLTNEVKNGAFLKDQEGLTVKLTEGAFADNPREERITASEVADVIAKTYSAVSKVTEGYNSGNKRFFVRFFALALVLKMGKEHPDYKRVLSSMLQTPAVLKSYSSEKARLLENVSANERDAEHKSNLTHLDIIKVGLELRRLGATQTEIRDHFKAGTGQKLWEVLWLNERLPQVKIVDRIRSDSKAPGHIQWGPLHKEKMRALRTSIERDPETKKVRPMKLQKVMAKDPTVIEAVTTYFADPKAAGGGNASKIENRKAIEDALGASQVEIVDKVLQAIFDRTLMAVVKDLNEKAAERNEAESAISAGKPVVAGFEHEGDLVTEERFQGIVEQLNTLLAASSKQTGKRRGRKSG